MPFPVARFRRAGALPDQLDQLAADYDALDAVGQADLEAKLAPLSDYDIAERYLGDSRDFTGAERAALDEPEPEPESDDEPDDDED